MDREKRETLQMGAAGGAALLLGGQVFAGAAEGTSPITIDPRATTLVNVLTCEPADQAALLELLRENTDRVITTLDGWRATSFVAAEDGSRVTIISQWRDVAAVRAMQSDERMKAYFPRIGALAKIDSVTGKVAYARHA